MTTFDATNKNPFELFNQWMDDAIKHEPNNPNAMCLSTVSSTGKPSSRMVLLKDYSDNGFTFYTNSKSRKGNELSSNPNVALCLYWKSFQRQVRIEGTISAVPKDQVQTYFNSRYRDSQIASYASKQSQILENKSDYEDRIKELENEFKDIKDIPCPDHWNGYLVTPTAIEFWVEGEFRTHDRFLFKQDDNKKWIVDRLYP